MESDPAGSGAEECVHDDFRIQEWMIWSIPGIQEYAVRDGAFVIRDGRHTFNRPLFGSPGAIIPFGGDRPQWLLAEIGLHKLGILSLAVGDRWLHAAAEIETAYDAGRLRHVVRDPAFAGNTVTITTLRLPEGAGCVLRLEAECPLEIRWVFGGLRGKFPTDWAGSGGWEGGLHPEDAAGNHVEVRAGVACLTSPDVPGRVVGVAGGSPGTVHLAGSGGKAPRPAADEDQGAPSRGFAPTPDEGYPAAGGTLSPGEASAYLVIAGGETIPDLAVMAADGEALFGEAEALWRARAERLAVSTPMPELDAAIRSNNASLDGIWRPPSFLHGAVRWATRGWYLGWRGWYGPICAGDCERVRQAIRFHAAHPILEPGTGIQSRGAFHAFIGFDGRPERHEYDMNQVFLDHIRAYYAWTGDLETIRAVWPAIRECLAYERREMDPDGDGLYTNHLNTWVSDGHHYDGGGCAQASAYLYRLNRFAAEVAERLGEDPAPFREEAMKIRAAAQERLWMEEAGHFAEHVDEDGVLHPAAEAPSVYHPIEFGLADPLQALRLTEYLARRIWFTGDQVLANDWFPVIVTNGCPAHNESLNSALAYFQAGDHEGGWRLLRTAVGAFHRAAAPGSVSCYAGPEGEQGVYVDFADAVSLFARCVVEGLFGLAPDVPSDRVTWAPRLPPEWPRASLCIAGYALAYERSGTSERYTLAMPGEMSATIRVPLRFDRLKSVRVNGGPAAYQGETGVDRQIISVRAPAGRKVVLEVAYSSRTRSRVSDPPEWVVAGDTVSLATPAGAFTGVEDPQHALERPRADGGRLEARAGRPGKHAFHARLKMAHSPVVHPVRLEVRPAYELLGARLCVPAAAPGPPGLVVTLRCNRPERVPPPVEILYAGRTYRGRLAASSRRTGRPPGEPETFEFPIENPGHLTPGGMPVRGTLRTLSGPVVLEGETRLWSLFRAWPEGAAAFAARCAPLDIPRNDRLEAIFTREYQGPDQPFLNCWTWYRPETINLDRVRERLRDGVFTTEIGVPFRIPREGDNVLCATRWRSHPDEVTIPVGRAAQRLYLLLANTTQNSQTHLPHARVTLEYADGQTEKADLAGPEEIDHLLQHYAVRACPQWIGGSEGGFYGHGLATGAHADILDLHPGRREPIARLRIRCLRRETLIGVLGVTVW
ncbi:MAG: hypothetical protein HY321_09465 [Armatimonadetes bacterium]|nr:hypothetical protein [Armatimonadota bacterium]